MAVQACDYKLSAELTVACEDTSNSGVMNTAYIMNYDDVDWDTVKASRIGNAYTDFKMKNGKYAYAAYVPGKTPFTGTNKALATGSYKNTFTKQVKLVILSNGAGVAKNIIDPLANGRFVVIIENSFQGKDGDNTFEVYGADQGLGATEMSDDKYSEETAGGWSVTLEETNASTSGLFIFDTDAKTSRAIVESLVAPTT